MIYGLICLGKKQSQQLLYFPGDEESVWKRKKKQVSVNSMNHDLDARFL